MLSLRTDPYLYVCAVGYCLSNHYFVVYFSVEFLYCAFREINSYILVFFYSIHPQKVLSYEPNMQKMTPNPPCLKSNTCYNHYNDYMISIYPLS